MYFPNLGVPVEKHSEGSIQGSTEKDKTLVIDKTTYAEGDYSDTAAKGRVNLSLIWTIVAVYVVAGGLTVGILIVHKKRKKNTRK